MSNQQPNDLWRRFTGPNLAYVQEQYELYLEDAESVSPQYRELFETLGAPPRPETVTAERLTIAAPAVLARSESEQPAAYPASGDLLKKAILAGKLVSNIRAFGHMAADIDPLDLRPQEKVSLLQPETYGLTRQDLESLPAEWVWKDAPYSLQNGWEAISRLCDVYSGTIAFEFSHVHDEKELTWLRLKVEADLPSSKLGDEERKALFTRLVEAESFEEFLHRTFVGQKRFSAEGVDVLPALTNELVHELVTDGARHILMGMAHRGRLNVLAHVLGKPYSTIFSEFHHAPNKKLVPSEGSTGINYGWTGDVKYHLGANRSIKTGHTAETRLTMANNPSHLEFVNPVVEGFTRAAQEDRTRPGFPVQDLDSAAAILMHGDAAFPGEGIVTETLNLGNLRGYSNGGTIHIIVNNRIGFTTDSRDSRSTRYASDPAKGFEIPIVHVSADDPEACIAAARMAAEYRTQFKKDFLIDLVGYRRYGHNETDDPETTQPLVYRKVKGHPSVSRIYADRLVKEGVLTEAEVEEIRAAVMEKLKLAYDEVKKQSSLDASIVPAKPIRRAPGARVSTGVPLEKLRRYNEALLKRPEGFTVYPKLQRILERRIDALNDGEKIDWGHAETLAFASIIADGTPIRLSGQDAERATFAHRNLVLHDSETGETYCPLHALDDAKASFAIHNSPLSEAAVLGFEYGYNVYAPETMVIWEAQYGDFANVAQVLFDQFISAGRSKWNQLSGLTMLLPHGYEGQGPEHSSARLERFLQLSAEENWTVAYLSSAAQYFHLLRRQAAYVGTEAARPLVLMAPKSLIRNPRVASPASAFAEGSFRTVIEQPGLGGRPDRVERLILCTGKMAIDLEEGMSKFEGDSLDGLHILRVEQLYPFPKDDIAAVIGKLPALKEICWVQEEPENMGAWRYMEHHLRGLVPAKAAMRYIGRVEHSSPASGYQRVHAEEQQEIIAQALQQTIKSAETAGR